MNILFASFEAAPFYKTGGLGDVAGSLPIALAKVGVSTRLILPGYEFLHLPNKKISLGSFSVIFNHKEEKVNIYKMDYVEGVSLLIIYHKLLANLKDNDTSISFSFFSKAIATMLSINNNNQFGQFDIVHLHDWHVASVAYFLSKTDKAHKIPTLLTIHNLMYQGGIGKDNLSALIGSEITDPNYQSLLELGIKYSDFVTTVSPSYAKEIIKAKHGMNLGNLLFGKKDRVKGILNGINHKVWNPQTDDLTYLKYGQENLSQGKLKNKLALQKELKLNIDSTSVIVSFIGRLEPRQKGIDLICKIMVDIFHEKNLQLIILGTGHKSWAKKIGVFASIYPHRLAFINKFNENLSHKIYAASDIMLVPSKFEPCGLIQMIAMRYGTLPLVRKTGGLADTVIDNKTGFVFERYSPTELSRTLRVGLKLFRENPDKIAEMRINAMKQDFSWDKSAREYKKLYQKLVSKK